MPLFAGDIAGDLERQAVGCVQVRRGAPRERRLPAAWTQVVELFHAGATRRCPRVRWKRRSSSVSVDEDGGAMARQLRIDLGVGVDGRFGHAGQERLREPGLAAEAAGAADDHAADVIAAGVARHDAVGDQEGRRAGVIRDHPVGREQLARAATSECPARRLDAVEHAAESDRCGSWSPTSWSTETMRSKPMPVSTCLAGSGSSCVGLERLYWMKTRFHSSRKRWQSPLTRQTWPGTCLLVAGLRAQVDVDLAVRAAGAGLGHLPEVVLAPEEQHVVREHARLLAPDVGRLVVARDDALLVLEARSPTGGRLGRPQTLGQQFPGPGDGFLLVVVAERPVAEHLEEGVVRVVAADVVQVVVLAGHAHALLRSRRRGCRAALPVPRKTSLNWTMPELVKSRVWSPPGTSDMDGTMVWPRAAKKSRKALRMA